MRYTKKIRAEIYKLLATTNCDIAKLCRLIGIDRSTYYKWYNNFEEFRNIIKKSRAEFRSIKRENVISSLYKRAMGYTVTEVRETIKENAQGEQTEKKIVYYKKYIPPSEKAIKYFLENFDEQGYEISIDDDYNEDDDDDSIDDDDDYNEDDVEEEEISIDDDDDVVDDNKNYPLCHHFQCTDVRHADAQGTPLSVRRCEGVESLRQEQVDSIKSQIEEEEIIERETENNIINSETQTVPVGEMQCIEVQAEIIVSPEVAKHAKLRRAVAWVISKSSPEIQKQVQEEIENQPEIVADYLVGLPTPYAMRVASWTYEDKKIEYRKKHNIPLNDYQVKPSPVTFNEDAGTRRMNTAYRERMHDIPLFEEAKALKKYIIAARMEKYYEDLLITHKCYYSTIWD